MKPHPPRIIAICPGTKHMGIAVPENGNLVHHAVESVRERGSPHETLEEARRIVLRLLRDFRPATVVYERAPRA
jgi:RNase H-fold protein (predicted Holliday junction resolvase)